MTTTTPSLRRVQAGFTFLEVMISIGLFAVVSVSLVSSMSSSFEAKRNLTIINERYHD